VTGSRRAALALLAAGGAVAVAARLVAPAGMPPLYDSFAAPSPYVYLHPGDGQAGHPASATTTQPITAQGVSALVLATPENPPQAQLIVGDNGLTVPAGARSITATITPVDTPSTDPPNGVVAGNTYRFRIVTDGGATVGVSPGKPVTLVLRGPTGIGAATVDAFDGSGWHPLSTTPVAGPDIFAANTTALGDAALVVASLPPASSRFGWLPWAAGAVVVVVVAGAAVSLLLSRRRNREDR